MVLQCLTWIPHLWGQLVCSVSIHKTGFFRPLPDDIVIDILSRLPADCVLECRKVSRQWLALTSTSYFTEMHLKRAASLLFVQHVDFKTMEKNELDLFILDEGAKKDKMFKKMRAGSMHIRGQNIPLLFGSCNGLLVFRPMFHNIEFLVCNPVTREQITIRSPVHPGKLCGFFFHLLTKEYRLLYAHQKGYCFQYFIYSLGGKMWRKLASFSYWPTSPATPAILNGALHWMVEHRYENEDDIPPCRNSVMMFNMDIEDFHSMPHPGNECPSRLTHEKMHLLEMEGQLSFFHLYYPKLIDMWVLEDYGKWIWVKRYKVNLDWDIRRYPFDFGDTNPYCTNYRIRLLNIQNGELLLEWFTRGLFRYHLGQNTVRKIDRAGMKMPGLVDDVCNTTAYIKSLVSLSSF